MIKKYKLDDTIKPFISNRDNWHTDEMPLDWWNSRNIKINALIEVNETIQLQRHTQGEDDRSFLSKVTGGNFTTDEVNICEQALNGELYTTDEVLKVVHNYSNATINLDFINYTLLNR